MSRRGSSARDCVRALWLLGLEPPVDQAELQAAWRNRVARSHPDRHVDDARRARAAETLTRGLNDARQLIEDWIEGGNPWPDLRAARTVRLDGQPPEPWPERQTRPPPKRVCPQTGLRAGDQVLIWPFTGDLHTVDDTASNGPAQPASVHLAGGVTEPATRVKLAAFSCPVCGACSGPAVSFPNVRPCPDCLVDLRRLGKRPAEAPRIRRAIEARSQAGITNATVVGDARLASRAADRRRWARRLANAEEHDLLAALLSAFGTAYERWAQPSPAHHHARTEPRPVDHR